MIQATATKPDIATADTAEQLFRIAGRIRIRFTVVFVDLLVLTVKTLEL
jgi:hypothetical protein